VDPAAIVQTFFVTLGELRLAAHTVAGANPKSLELRDIEPEWFKDNVNWRIDNVTILKHTATEAEVAADVTIRTQMGIALRQTETVSLKRGETALGPMWQIIPRELGPDADWAQVENTGCLRYMAALVAHPREFLDALRLQRSFTQLSDISFGLHQYFQDHDNKYPATAAEFRKGILPFIEGEWVFTAPLTKEGTQSFNLNLQLAGISKDKIAEPSRTVEIYIGQDGKLEFPYNGHTLVAFADDHSEVINAEQAKKLRWKP
jgi:hypothetical protein